jgi:hypothetical protein
MTGRQCDGRLRTLEHVASRCGGLLALIALATTVAACSLLQRDKPPASVVHVPQRVWRERPPEVATAAPVAPTTRPGLDTAAIDRQLFSYLGLTVQPGLYPPGCPTGWVYIPYDARFQALGCNAFVVGSSDLLDPSTVQGELALDGTQVHGVILTRLVQSMDVGLRLARDFRALYDAGCQCRSYSDYEYDCTCNGYQVRTTVMQGPNSGQPGLRLFYYLDGPRFNEYWAAAMNWARSR